MSGVLERLKARFLESYPDQHAELEHLGKRIRTGDGDRDALIQFTRVLHRIGGTAGTIGLTALGHAAQEGEHRMLMHLDTRPSRDSAHTDVTNIVDDFLMVSSDYAKAG